MPAKEFNLTPIVLGVVPEGQLEDRLFEELEEAADVELVRNQPRIRRRYRPVYLKGHDRRH